MMGVPEMSGMRRTKNSTREHGFTLISMLVSLFIVTIASVVTSQVFSLYFQSRATIDKDQLLMDNDEAIAQMIFEKVKEYRNMNCNAQARPGYQVSKSQITKSDTVNPIMAIKFGALADGLMMRNIDISREAPIEHLAAAKRCNNIRIQSGDFHFCLLFLGDYKYKNLFPPEHFLRGISPFAEVSIRQFDHARNRKICRPESESSRLEFLEGTITFFWGASASSKKKDLFYQRMFYFRSKE